jgi:hypothetical protein
LIRLGRKASLWQSYCFATAFQARGWLEGVKWTQENVDFTCFSQCLSEHYCKQWGQVIIHETWSNESQSQGSNGWKSSDIIQYIFSEGSLLRKGDLLRWFNGSAVDAGVFGLIGKFLCPKHRGNLDPETINSGCKSYPSSLVLWSFM